jgi:hypothetical protein
MIKVVLLEAGIQRKNGIKMLAMLGSSDVASIEKGSKKLEQFIGSLFLRVIKKLE